MILALDASSEVGSVALCAHGRTLRELTFAAGRGGRGGTAAALREVAEGEDVGGVVVGLGPGSYSGVRAAVAAAWGFAAARGLGLRGVSSLLALGPGEYIAAGDARRGDYFFAHVRDGAFVAEPRLVSADALRGLLEQAGGLPVLTPSSLGSLVPHALIRYPSAALLAAFGVEERIQGLPPMPAPIYLKPPHVTLPKSLAS